MLWFYKKLIHEELKSDEVLFDFLTQLINKKDLIDLDLRRLEKAKSLPFEKYKCESVAVYFSLEKYITEHTVPDVEKVYNVSALRNQIIKTIPVNTLNERLQVVFMVDPVRKIFLYELYVKALVRAFTSALGSRELTNVYDKNFKSSQLKDVKVNKDQYDFSAVNEDIFNLPEEEIEEMMTDIQDACKGAVVTLYSTTEIALGEGFAKKAASTAFDSFAKFYDYGIIRSILEILPTNLSETQRLLFLNREELESEVEAKSAQLNKIEKEKRRLAEKMAQDLEIKVKERTKDLNIFKLAVESASDHIIITDEDSKIIYANQAAERITGYTIKEMIGKTPALWGGNMSEDFYKELWQTISKKKESFEGEINNKRKNGESYTAQLHIAPVMDESTDQVYYVGIERDITKENEIANMKSEFVSVASHQLRTPLTEIRWAFDSLLEDPKEKLTPKQQEVCTSGMKATLFTVSLVNDLLNVSKMSEHGIMAERDKQSVVQLATDVYNIYTKIAEKKGVDLTLSPEGEIPELPIDKKQIGMALSNFVDNAIKYTDSGGKVDIKIKQEQGNVILCVSDTGIGIPSTQIDQLFSKFFRANNAKLRETDGFGLGLYIAKTIVEGHGGEVKVTSELEKGTQFSIILPIKKV